MINNNISQIHIHSDFGRRIRFDEKVIDKLKCEEMRKLFLKILFVLIHEYMDEESIMVWNELKLLLMYELDKQPTPEMIAYIPWLGSTPLVPP